MQRLIDFKRPTLAALIEDETFPTHWVRSQCLSVYVRKGKHFVHEGGAVHVKPCLMVANWGLQGCRHRHRLENPRTGAAHLQQLVSFMKEVEQGAVRDGYEGVFVECVGREELRYLLRKNGYTQLGAELPNSAPNFFKPIARILERSPWVAELRQPIHSTQRPSLRSFIRDASLKRFWVRDQHAGLHILLKRDWIHCALSAPTQRLSIVDMFHCTVSEHLLNWSLYWEDDHNLILSALSRVERQGSREGFCEIAINDRAVFSGSRADHSLPLAEGPRAKTRRSENWLLDRGYELETAHARRGAERYYVKRTV